MSKQVKIYTVDSDITSINCDVFFASVTIATTSQPKLTVEFIENKNINVANTDNALYIKQDKCMLTPFSKKPKIIINVPECVVPALSITGSTLSLRVFGGIYAGCDVYAENGKVGLYNAAFDSVEVKGNKVLFLANGITVRGILNSVISGGETLLESIFAKHAELINKRGNIGAINLSCKDSSFESQSGNLSLTLAGERKDYNLSLLSKGGTCNLDSDGKTAAGKNNLKAYTEKGNIMIDFTSAKAYKFTDKEQNVKEE